MDDKNEKHNHNEKGVVSLNDMLHTVLVCKCKLMDNNVDKLELYSLLNSLEFNILAINNDDFVLEEDLV